MSTVQCGDHIARMVNGQYVDAGPIPCDPDPSLWVTYNLGHYLTVAATIFGIVVVAWLIRKLIKRVVVYVPNDSVGVVEKLWSRHGSVSGGFLSMDNRAGFQPDLLRGGFHLFFPLQYRIHLEALVTVPQGTIGYIFSRTGVPLHPEQTLAISVDASFEDVRAFLAAGGQRGPQRTVLREGLYAINTAAFVIMTADGHHAVEMDDKEEIEQMAQMIADRHGYAPVTISGDTDQLGVVTVHDGAPLSPGEIIAPMVTGHAAFQQSQAFLDGGGKRGRQAEVLMDGTWYINRLFATIDLHKKEVVDVGWAGVVVSYAGQKGEDSSGEDFRHGELVAVGERGVWCDPLGPGKYALNPYAIQLRQVPVTNFVLRWTEEGEDLHGYDANLTEIRLITLDAFEPILPLSIVVHIDYDKAPRIVQRFSDIKLLVEQTLDPMVSAYFRDAAQGFTLLKLIQNRSELQEAAREAMAKRFSEYDLNCKEVMIGTPRAARGDDRMAAVLDQLRLRQVAVEQAVTFEAQREAQVKAKALAEDRAKAEAQPDLTKSSIAIQIADNEGAAQLARRTQEAAAVKVTAEAEGARLRITGAGEAEKTRVIGLAQAEAIRAQVEASGGAEYQLRRTVSEQLSTAIQGAKVQVVPSVIASGGGEGESGIVQALLAMVARTAVTQPTGEQP